MEKHNERLRQENETPSKLVILNETTKGRFHIVEKALPAYNEDDQNKTSSRERAKIVQSSIDSSDTSGSSWENEPPMRETHEVPEVLPCSNEELKVEGHEVYELKLIKE